MINIFVTNINIVLFNFVLIFTNALDYRGRFANIGELPYAVHIVIDVDKGRASCTGGLIEKSWILSAAHCFFRGERKANPQDVTITAGINDTTVSVPSKQVSKAIEIHVHPEYTPDMLSKYDFALVKLATPFTLNKNVSTIPLEGTTWPFTDGITARDCVAGGFGRITISPEGENTKLKYMKVKALHGDRSCPCTKRWQWKRMICLKPEDGLGLCPGDSGGLLACNNKAIGVAHAIMDRRTCSFIHMPDPRLECLKNTTITFLMFTCPENDWVKKFVPTVPSTPESCKSSVTRTSLLIVLCCLYFTKINFNKY